MCCEVFDQSWECCSLDVTIRTDDQVILWVVGQQIPRVGQRVCHVDSHRLRAYPVPLYELTAHGQGGTRLF